MPDLFFHLLRIQNAKSSKSTSFFPVFYLIEYIKFGLLNEL